MLSLELVSSRRQQDAESQAREDFLADLLQGDREPERLLRRSASYGIDLDAPHVLVRVSWDPDAQHRITGTARRAYFARRLGDGSVACTSPPPASPAPTSSSVRCRATADAQAMEAVRVAVRSALDSSGLRTKSRGALVSGACTEVAHYAEAHRDLRVVLESMGGAGIGRPVALVGDMGVLRAFMSSGTAESARRFADELLAPLVERDKTGAELVVTLRTFLDCNAQYRKTATDARRSREHGAVPDEPGEATRGDRSRQPRLAARRAVRPADPRRDDGTCVGADDEIDSDRRLTIPTTRADTHSWRDPSERFTLAPIRRHEHLGVWSWRC